MTVQQQPVTQSNQVVIGPAGDRSLVPTMVSINPTIIGNQLVSAGHPQLQTIVSQPGDLQAAAAAAAAQQQIQQAAAVAAAAQQQQLQQQAAQQQSEQAPSMPLLMTSPERTQIEVQTGVMPPPPPATPMSVDEKAEKANPPKKDGADENGNASTGNDFIFFKISVKCSYSIFPSFKMSILFLDADQRASSKDDNHEAAKPDDKASNPLLNLANAVNSITNGNMEETNVLEPLPTTVNKQAPCKAIVKPQVLTHVIEGFVIQECKFF